MRSIGLTLFALVFTLAACQSSNPPLTGPQPPDEKKKVREVDIINKKAPKIKFDARVDILFIIDDSNSMANHQSNLARNMIKFVDGFAKTADGKASNLDFHIAYTFAHDRTRYNTKNGIPQICPSGPFQGQQNWQPAGTLQPMLGLEGKRRYVNNADDFRSILSKTLNPDVNKAMVKPSPFNPGDRANLLPCGPETEELFTPLVEFFNYSPDAQGPNKGFRREGAFFVAVILSDTLDRSEISAQEVYNKLKLEVGQGEGGKQNFRVFSVVMREGDPLDDKMCKPDFEWAPLGNQETYEDATGQTRTYVGRDVDKLIGRKVLSNENAMANLALLTEDGSLPAGSQVLSICSGDYGAALAQYGAQIQEDVYKDVKFRLKSTPQAGTLQVFIEAENIKGGRARLKEGVQWDIDFDNLVVTIYNKTDTRTDGVDFKRLKNARIRPTWIPVDTASRDARAVK